MKVEGGLRRGLVVTCFENFKMNVVNRLVKVVFIK